MRLSLRAILLLVIGVKIALHLMVNGLWSFHRDELLYLALGRRLDWGFASVPPAIGFWAWFGNNVLGGGVEGIRLIATLTGTATVWLTALMAVEFLPVDRNRFSGKYAVLLVGLSGLLCGAFLRPSMMLMPVVFDLFYWTLLCWLGVKYIKTENKKWLLWFGAATGAGLLNKYSVLMLLAAFLPGLLFTEHRKLLKNKYLYLAAGIALLVFSPNIWWQVAHNFPVVRHIGALAASQFVHVSLPEFFLDQIRFFLPAAPLWIAGLYLALFNGQYRQWRLFGWMYLGVMAILLAFSAKSYYSLGVYPVLIALGAAHFERITVERRRWLRVAMPLFMLATGLPLMPLLMPVYPPVQEAKFMEKIKQTPGLEGALRWEDGQYHTLPQDFADMLGWKEVADLTKQAWDRAPDKSRAAIYAENYGLAGAIEQFGRDWAPDVICFSDSYQYWLPDSLPADFQTLVYVNDELGDDMPGFFKHIEEIGRVNMPLSRQHNTQVYLCTGPTPTFFERMSKAFSSYAH